MEGVAQEAYLTRLEQGRDRSPSAQVLAALAETLGLSRDERIYLHRLAKTAAGGGACDGPATTRARTVRPTVQALLDRLEPAPALVANPPGDLLGWTAGFARLAGVERWAHPEAGELRLAYESLELPDPDEQRLVVYLASDEATAAALDCLTDRHPAAT